MTRRSVFQTCLVLLMCGTAIAAADWPQWRGPQRTGITSEKDLPPKWDGKTKEGILWKVPADFGHSSPIVLGEQVFITASVRKAPKSSDQIAANHTHRIVCYGVADGAKTWQADIEPGPWDTQFSFTASTPATDGKRVYGLFGSGTIAAVDLAGKLLWQKTLPGPFKAEWLVSSPIVHEGMLFVFVDVSSDAWLLALDAASGEVKWELKRPQKEKSHNSSPAIVTVNGKAQLVVAGPDAVLGLEPASGKMIWTCKWNGNRYPSLVENGSLVFVTGEGCESLAIDPTGEGDVSKTHVKWRHPKAPRGFGAPIIVGDYLYRASPPGAVRCWKVSDGQPVYEEAVEGVPTYTSPVATADGLIYFAGPGRTVVIKAGPKLETVAVNDLNEGERNNNEGGQTGPSMAVANGRIYLRGPKSLNCVGKRQPEGGR